MTMTRHPFDSVPMPDDMTAAIAIAIWKEAHDIEITTTPEFLYSPGELHGLTPAMTGHLGTPMLRRGGRRRQARRELGLAH